MIKVDFKPLEYIEVKHGKPLIIKLNDKWMMRTELQIADNFLKFNTSKNIILDNLDRLNNIKNDSKTMSLAKILCYKQLIRLLYEISKNNYKGFFKRRKYYKFLMKFFMADVEMLINAFQKILDYNTELKKKLQNLRSTELFRKGVLDTTVGGQSLQDLIIVDPVTGEKRFKH